MVDLTVTLVSVLSVSLVGSPDPTEAVRHLQWIHVWLPHLGLVGMGLRGLLGGDDDDDESDQESSEDPLGYGFGGQGSPAGDSFEETIGDDLGGEADPLAEVEPRIDDVEAQMDDLESTVSAVRDQQEAVSESLEEIEGNVRKLLEVYEVVTQGMNPFADADAVFTGGGNAADGAGSFGFMEEQSEPPEPDEGVPEDSPEEPAFEELEPTDEDPPETPDEPAGEEGLSFDDLKSEFDFVGDEPPPPGDHTAGTESQGPDLSRAADPPRKPYLREVPTGFGSDLLIVEWLDFLVAESSIQATLRAIQYYTTLAWIDDDVADHLATTLTGISVPPDVHTTDGGHPIELTVEHHLESLEYVSKLRAIASPGRSGGDVATSPTAHHLPNEEDHGVQR